MRKVICIETKEVFQSARAASMSLGYCESAVWRAIKNNWKCGGYTWEYYEGDEKGVNAKTAAHRGMMTRIKRSGKFDY